MTRNQPIHLALWLIGLGGMLENKSLRLKSIPNSGLTGDLSSLGRGVGDQSTWVH